MHIAINLGIDLFILKIMLHHWLASQEGFDIKWQHDKQDNRKGFVILLLFNDHLEQAF